MATDLDVFGTLLRTVRKQERFSGIRELLKEIAEYCDAEGAILWRVRERAPNPEQYLYAASSYFANTDEPLYMDLTRESPGAKAFETERPDISLNAKVGRVDPEHVEYRLLEKLNVRRHITAPMWVDGEPYGLLTIVDSKIGLFAPETVQRVESVALVFPHLAETLSEAVSGKLLTATLDILAQSSKADVDRRALTRDPVERACHEIGRAIQEAFQIVEYGIYLDREGKDAKGVARIAGDWPWTNRPARDHYDSAEGTTGYCLKTGKMVIVEDIQTFYSDYAYYEGKYKGLKPSWSQNEVESAVQTVIRPHAITGKLPPVPLLCIPLLEGNKAIGVLRVCGVKDAPYYLDEQQLRGLQRIAANLAHWAGARLRLRTVQELDFLAKTAVSQVRNLSGRQEDSEDDIARTLVDSLKGLGAGVDVVCFRRFQEDRGRGLLTTAFEWRRDSTLMVPTQIPVTTTGRGEASPWDLATEYRKTRHVPDTEREKVGRGGVGLRSIAVAPVCLRGGRSGPLYGTLDIYSRTAGSFSNSMIEALGTLAEEMAQLMRLTRAIRKERELIDLRNRETKEVREGLENLQHQLKTPVRLVKGQVDLLAKRTGLSAAAAADLAEIQASARRAFQIVNRIEMFTALARGEDLQLFSVDALSKESILNRLEEAARLFLVDIPPGRGVGFHIQRDDFQVLDRNVVRVDLGMLDQVIDILLDNAVKYGEDQSPIEIGGGLTKDEKGRTYFYLAVRNRGNEIPAREVSRLKERGRRSERVAGKSKGTGLGLYIATEILHAHGGKLDLIGTTRRGTTEVRAWLPIGVTR